MFRVMKTLLWPLLGGVRFFLALIVAGAHLGFFIQPRIGIISFWSDLSGFAAVLGFLAISGFSIAASLSKEPKGFYRRRAIRIVPLYAFSIAVAVLVARQYGKGNVFELPDWKTVVENLFFLQGFTASGLLLANFVIWSLSIEVFFYAFAPLLVRLRQPTLLSIIGASAIIFLRDADSVSSHYMSMTHGQAAAVLAWAWLSGFFIYRCRNRSVACFVFLVGFLALLTLNKKDLDSNWPVTICLTLLAVGFGEKLRGPQWVANLLVLLGDASYPLYLFHLPLYLLLSGWHAPSIPWLWLVAAIALSIFLDRCVDQHVKKLFARPNRTAYGLTENKVTSA